MSAEVQVANEVPALIAASNRYQLAVAALKNLIGDDTEDFDVAGELEYVPVTVSLETLQQTAQSRPLALAAQTVVHLREQDLAVTRGQDKPSINATFSYNGANSSGFVSYEDDWQWHWNAGLTLQWNLWDGGRTRGMVREKKLELEKASDALVDLNRLTDLEATQAHLDMIAAAESIAGTEKGIDLAESTMKLARSRYEQGLVTHLEYTASSLALSRARFMRLQALCSHMNAVARLQYACGLDDDAFERLCRGEQDNSGEINAD
jgi:outer membrane protein